MLTEDNFRQNKNIDSKKLKNIALDILDEIRNFEKAKSASAAAEALALAIGQANLLNTEINKII